LKLSLRSEPRRGAQILGLTLILISVLGYTGVWWFGAYWDNEYVETYQGYNIHYFPDIGVYGLEEEGKDPQSWRHFYADLEAARRGVDSLLSEPEYVEEYQGYQVYHHPVYDHYWAEDSWGNTVAQTQTLEELHDYLDSLAPEPEPEPEPGPGEEEPETIGDLVDQRRETVSLWMGSLGFLVLAVGTVVGRK